MMHEKENWKKSILLTLTYSDLYLPIGGDLVKRDLQLFIKRIRKAIAPRKIKYFACGEYGEKRGRPHYHGVFFGIGASDKFALQKAWQLGFINIQPVTRDSCKYVTKYVTKAPLGRSKRDWYYFEREPEFQINSQGIGLSWVIQNFERLGEKGISYKGRKIPVPRYYIEKGREFGMSDTFLEDSRVERLQRSRLDTLKLLNKGLSYEAIAELHRARVQQRIEDIKSRDGLFGTNDTQ